MKKRPSTCPLRFSLQSSSPSIVTWMKVAAISLINIKRHSLSRICRTHPWLQAFKVYLEYRFVPLSRYSKNSLPPSTTKKVKAIQTKLAVDCSKMACRRARARPNYPSLRWLIWETWRRSEAPAMLNRVGRWRTRSKHNTNSTIRRLLLKAAVAMVKVSDGEWIHSTRALTKWNRLRLEWILRDTSRWRALSSIFINSFPKARTLKKINQQLPQSSSINASNFVWTEERLARPRYRNRKVINRVSRRRTWHHLSKSSKRLERIKEARKAWMKTAAVSSNYPIAWISARVAHSYPALSSKAAGL